MNRHINTEQLGINAVNTVVYEELDWIYRPVPPPDVGIDGTIEQKINGEPTAKFIAVQLKTGLSHFNYDKRKNRLTYRASLIHYNYWISSNIPVILVAYIPDWKKSYWQIIDKTKFKKLPRSWQLDIPLNNILGKSSIKEFNRILSQESNKDGKSKIQRTNFDYVEDAALIKEANERVITITVLLRFTSDKASISAVKMREYFERELSYEHLEVDAHMTSIGRFFKHISRRFALQIEIFAECYAQGISALPKLMKLQFDADGEYEDLEGTIETIDGLKKGIKTAIKSMQGLQDVLRKMEKQKNIMYNEGIELLHVSISQIVNEFTIAFEMADELGIELKELK